MTTLGRYSHDQVAQVFFLPDDVGRLVSYSSDKAITIWNYKTGEQVSSLTEQTDSIVSLVLLEHGRLASGSEEGSIRIWDLREMKLARTLNGHTEQVFSLLALPNRNLASLSRDGFIKIWNLYSSSAQECLVNIRINCYANDCWGISRRNFGVLSNGNMFLFEAYRNEFAEDTVITMWDQLGGQAGKSICTLGNRVALVTLVLRNDNVVAGFYKGLVRVLDLNAADDAARRIVLEIETGFDSITDLRETRNGHLVSAGDIGQSIVRAPIHIWDLETGILLQTWLTDYNQSLMRFSFSPDETVFVTSSNCKSINVWALDSDNILK